MAHAAARRRGAARDEADHGLGAPALRLVGEELGCVLLGGAADLADHDDRARLVVGKEQLEHVDEARAVDRIAADADCGRLAKPRLGGLVDRLVGQGPRAADHADRPLPENRARHDPDLALAGREHAGAVRTDQPGGGALQPRLDPDHVEHRNALGDRDDQRHPGLDRLDNRGGGELWRHINHARVRPGRLARLGDGVEHRQPEMRLPAFSGRYSGDHLRAVIERLLGVERASFAGHPLGDDLGVAVDEDGHAAGRSNL